MPTQLEGIFMTNGHVAWLVGKVRSRLGRRYWNCLYLPPGGWQIRKDIRALSFHDDTGAVMIEPGSGQEINPAEVNGSLMEATILW
jgi:hypothetical protein